MDKKTFSKEEKKAYFERLHKSWQESKLLAEQDKYKAIQLECLKAGLKVSLTGIVFTALQMEKLNLEGNPYIDCKTFKGWKDCGYTVKKGEHSQIEGLTWISSQSPEKQLENFVTGEDKSKSFVFPKVYKLFHSSQVEPLHR